MSGYLFSWVLLQVHFMNKYFYNRYIMFLLSHKHFGLEATHFIPRRLRETHDGFLLLSCCLGAERILTSSESKFVQALLLESCLAEYMISKCPDEMHLARSARLWSKEMYVAVTTVPSHGAPYVKSCWSTMRLYSDYVAFSWMERLLLLKHQPKNLAK